VWDGKRWAEDEGSKQIMHLAKRTAIRIHEEVSKVSKEEKEDHSKWAFFSEGRRALDNLLHLASFDTRISLASDALDQNPWSLNVLNGTVDLRTGKLRDHDKGDYITRLIKYNYNPEASRERWERTLLEIFEADVEMVDYVQRCMGYSISGDASEHALFIPVGTGRNGKNVVVDTVRSVISEYTWYIDPKLLLVSQKSSNHDSEALANLHGKRFVMTDEVEEGSRLYESLVKRVTGNQVISARHLYGDTFMFPITFTIWMPTNYAPEVQGSDEGIWSRLKLIPFDRFFEEGERAKGLSKRLVREEPEGILAWLVEGHLKYLKDGLEEPAKVEYANRKFREDHDTVEKFLKSRCEVIWREDPAYPNARTPLKVLYEAYFDFCRFEGLVALGKDRFQRHRQIRSIPSYESNGITYKLGLMLIAQNQWARATTFGIESLHD
jgi:putative DNA primase/helicase